MAHRRRRCRHYPTKTRVERGSPRGKSLSVLTPTTTTHFPPFMKVGNNGGFHGRWSCMAHDHPVTSEEPTAATPNEGAHWPPRIRVCV